MEWNLQPAATPKYPNVDAGHVEPYRCPPFDLDDEQRIRKAYYTGHPRTVYRALRAAIDGAKGSLRQGPIYYNATQGVFDLGEAKVFPGELMLPTYVFDDFFDNFAAGMLVQEICNEAQRPAAHLKHRPTPKGFKRPASPFVEFVPEPELVCDKATQ